MEAAVEVKDSAKKGLHSSIETAACVRQCCRAGKNDKMELTATIRAVTASVPGFMMRGSSAIAFSSFAMNILPRTEYLWASATLPPSSLYSMQSSNRTPNTNTRLTGPHSFGWLNISSHFCFRGIIVATGKNVRNRLSELVVSHYFSC